MVFNLSVCDLPGVRVTGLTAAEGREKLVMPFKCSLTCQMQGTADSLLLLPVLRCAKAAVPAAPCAQCCYLSLRV